MNEDMSRVRKDNAPENLATLRRIAINMVRKDKTPMKGRPSIRRAMKRAAYLNCSLEQILVNQMRSPCIAGRQARTLTSNCAESRILVILG